jgi:hypothetical protein
MLYELGAGHQTGHTAGSDSDRREDDEGNGDEQPVQGGDGGEINTMRPIGSSVSAWATENQLVFAQVQTEAKSNEITAIAALLEQIAIAGCIITIDAMGSQYEIAEQIVKKGMDYVYSLQGNQETLHEEVKEYGDTLDFNKSAAEASYIRFRTTSTY